MALHRLLYTYTTALHHHRYLLPTVTAALPHRYLHTTTTATMAHNVDMNALTFGKFKMPASQVFYLSPTGLTYASVNLKPIVPGHVLIIPVRNTARLHELTKDEVKDLFQTSVFVSTVLEQNYKTTAHNFGIQDGKDAGQSVPHVHVHILPRKKADFAENDEVYDQLDNHDATPATDTDVKRRGLVVDEATRKPRTKDEMAEEANQYRKWIEAAQQTTNTKSSM